MARIKIMQTKTIISQKIWNKIKYVLYFCILALLIDSILLIFSYNFKSNKQISDASFRIKEVSNFKINEINSYFRKVENEMQLLSNSDEAKTLLKKQIVIDADVTKFNVDQKTKIIAKETDNYVKKHPNKTLEDLRNDPIFQEITVQTIGLDGYSLIENYEEQLLSFQKNGEFIGEKYKDIKTSSPELYKKLTENINSPDIFGFYDWIEPNGKVRKKYIHLIRTSNKTADGITLMVVTTAYVDNFKIIKESSPFNNLNNEDFNNLFLINPDGNFIYAKNVKEDVGSNLNWPVNKQLNLETSFGKVKKQNKIVFSDAYIDSYGEIYPKFTIISPVYEQNKLIGYVALIKNMNTLFKITKDTKNLGETGESYLVNREQDYLISPLRKNNFDMFVQTIDTENTNNCFLGKKNRNNILPNYEGELTIATHNIISEVPWCLITEINKNEISKISLKIEWLVSIALFLFFGFIGLLATTKIGKISIKEVGIKSISKFEEFFVKLKMNYIILFSLFFSIAYFFLITSFFQGWNNAAFYNDIPDLFTITILVIMFFYGFKLKNNYSKNKITQGSLLAVSDKLIQIVLQEYNYKFGLVSDYFWIPGAILSFFGLLLIFYGFKKEIKL